jgi:hypothetical protein
MNFVNGGETDTITRFPAAYAGQSSLSRVKRKVARWGPDNVPSNASAVNYLSCDETCCRLPLTTCTERWIDECVENWLSITSKCSVQRNNSFFPAHKKETNECENYSFNPETERCKVYWLGRWTNLLFFFFFEWTSIKQLPVDVLIDSDVWLFQKMVRFTYHARSRGLFSSGEFANGFIYTQSDFNFYYLLIRWTGRRVCFTRTQKQTK